MTWTGVPEETGLLVSRRANGIAVYGIRYKDEHGRDIKRKVGPSKDAARQELQAARKEVQRRLMQVRRGIEEPGDGLTLGDLWRRYEPELRRKRSYRDDARYAKVWLDHFGEDRPISSIRPQDVRAWRRSEAQRVTRRGRPTSPATRNRHLAFLKRLFNMAQADELTTLQPVRKHALEAENNKRRRFLTTEEEARLLAEVRDEGLRRAILVALWTGLRSGEQCRLARADVDLEHEILLVRASKGHGDEVLPLHPEAVRVLRQVVEETREEVLFSRWSPDRLNKRLQSAARRSGVVDLHWHDLRRTFCSRLAMSGVSMEQIRALARHATLEVTAERYAHLSPAYLREALGKLESGNKPGNGFQNARKYPCSQVVFRPDLGSPKP